MWQNSQTGWHAFYVRTGHENKIKEYLEQSFAGALRFVVPGRMLNERNDGKWYRVFRHLFPGYILAIGQLSVDQYQKIKALPVMAHLLKDETGPLAICEEEVEQLQQLIDQDGTIGISSVFKENEQITIIDGPMQGLEGQISSVDFRKGRAAVKLQFLGQIRTIQLGIERITSKTALEQI